VRKYSHLGDTSNNIKDDRHTNSINNNNNIIIIIIKQMHVLAYYLQIQWTSYQNRQLICLYALDSFI